MKKLILLVGLVSFLTVGAAQARCYCHEPVRDMSGNFEWEDNYLSMEDYFKQGGYRR